MFSNNKKFQEQKMKAKDMAPAISIPKVDEYKSIIEGRAVLRVSSDKVFYNPVQEFNRDLSIVALTVFIEDYKKQKLLEAEKQNLMDEDKTVNITILEALSATGLRSIRYAKELVDVTKIVANDISLKAVETITDNVVFNNVDHVVETSHEDACLLMLKHKHKLERFSAVDLDPYGSPSIFLDGAVQCVAEGGLLLVTATDMAVLAGNSPETCYAKYGAISLKTKCCHEMALRILLQSIQSHANRYSRYIVPMLSVSADFYIRVFVRVYSGSGKCKETPCKLSMVYHCVGCDSFTLQPLGGFKPYPTKNQPDQMKTHLPTAPPVSSACEHCNQRHQMGGPIWSGPLHDQSFVERALDLVASLGEQLGTVRRLVGVLTVINEELPTPLYHTLDRLCGTMHTEMIPIMQIRSALLHAGYRVSYSHANKMSIKTDAPNKFIWDVMRTWVLSRPFKAERIETFPLAKHILAQPCTYEVVLEEREDANPESRREKMTRYQFNPQPNWGPGSRSTINTVNETNIKSKNNQSKRKAKTKNVFQKKRFSENRGNDMENKLVIHTSTSEAGPDVATEAVEGIADVEATEATDAIKPTNGDNNEDVGSTGANVDEALKPMITEDPADVKE